MSDFVDVVKSVIKDVDWDEVKVVVNLASGIIVGGKEILEMLQETGGMDQIQYLEFVKPIDAAIAVKRAQIVQSIKERKAAGEQ